VIDEQFKMFFDDDGLWIETEEALWLIDPDECITLAKEIMKRFTDRMMD